MCKDWCTCVYVDVPLASGGEAKMKFPLGSYLPVKHVWRLPLWYIDTIYAYTSLFIAWSNMHETMVLYTSIIILDCHYSQAFPSMQEIYVWPLIPGEKWREGLVHLLMWSTSSFVQVDIVLRCGNAESHIERRLHNTATSETVKQLYVPNL